MKFILYGIVLFTLCINGVAASELLGTISTNPKAPGGPGDITDDDNGKEVSSVESIGGSAVFLKNQQINEEKGKPDEVQVLGIEFYPDGSLVRGKDMKIYLIRDGVKKYISSLKELKQYAGQRIYDVSDDQLDEYKERNYFEGDLIREIEDVKVYVIENGKGLHILNLEELRRNYFGEEIYNLKPDEMKVYM